MGFMRVIPYMISFPYQIVVLKSKLNDGKRNFLKISFTFRTNISHLGPVLFYSHVWYFSVLLTYWS